MLVRFAGSLGLVIAVLTGCGPAPGPCADGEAQCDGVCFDIASNVSNCGGCGIVCDVGGGEACSEGACVPATQQRCEPGETVECFDGAPGTQGVGPCVAGTRSCGDDGFFGPCEGVVNPISEVCANGVDDDCNGVVDDDIDGDADGYTACGGDCCNGPGQGCAQPAKVNPGAFDAIGNELDDDCDGIIDNPVPACDTGLASGSANPMDYAFAMDLCQTATEADGRWGVISAELVLASGTGAPASAAHSIRPNFGSTLGTQFGDTMAVLSTGHAATPGQTNPNYAAFQVGQNMGTQSAVPADWLAANGGNIPNAPGCPTAGDGTANDPVMLKLCVRVPTNANSFSVSSYFFSSEYPEWVCSAFNDFWVILLDSAFAGMPANPPDKNLARYTAPNMSVYPIGVNLAYGNTGLFTACLNGGTGCNDVAIAGSTTTCTGVGELSGTGFDIPNPPTEPGTNGSCGPSNLAGGGTGWLTTSGNVIPGEVIELRFALWDTADHIYDSAVLLDNFVWNVDPSETGTVID